ncbi:zincin [Aaosphaeria arxii CBS 175.79]|uniref:Disintegrin and metalloproteinase domain-containing protein B n=1 Tax=Aaosphaeria arxii CBS 175.79 TaxID=1450172 RepID=A0A6A5XVR8_9PLEO|nr:zincin [Aaosphaeria arxii CBS 175.79]KAF2017415.1 zincin [Aaosphaeria arxii CBS 175.79]
MLISRAVAAIAAATLATLATATSTARNPLTSIGLAKNPSILTKNHRVTAVSTFDVAFDYAGKRVRLSLEPNHDIFVQGAKIKYLGADGTITKEEPIDRSEHKVYKGSAFVKRGNRWDNVGWARIYIKRDGLQPLFEGAFTVDHDHHHVQLSSSYKKTRYSLDPDIDLRDDEYMVVFRDSDISASPEHTELRKRDGSAGCGSDNLNFNMDSQHPIYQSMKPRDDGWFAMSKRQLDGTPGGGNGAGVNLVSTIGSTAGCPSTRKVALVGVATDCTYTNEFNSTNATRDNVIQQMNTASNLFESTFNISLGLADLVVTDGNCPTSVQQATPWNQACSNSVNIQDRLNLFSQWRGQQSDSNSHWTLLTTCNTASAVGLAWLGQACTKGASANGAGSSGETVAGANVVVRTPTEWQVIAHETGHTFGAVHDCTADACRDSNTVNSQQCCPLSSSTCDAGQRFIMNPSTAEGIEKFSPCSIGNICSALGRNSVKSECLSNNRGVTTISGQRCGNGIVEGDEECDCGGTEGCGNNQCCDPQTCKFKSNAVCDDSNEDCCRNCQLASSNTVCRASTGSCDPEEKCSGSSPYCPDDKTEKDGTDCGNNLQCASGQCTSRDQQCKTVMGSYTQNNDTYACDNRNCMLSCASPEFGRGNCYGLNQNFLDGTPCSGGGRCQNGQCSNSNVGSEISEWFKKGNNQTIVIAVASGVGGLLALCILGCCWRSYKRRNRQKKYAAAAAASAAPYGYGGGNNRSRSHRGNGPPGPVPPQPQMGQHWQPSNVPQPPPPMFQRSSSVRYA